MPYTHKTCTGCGISQDLDGFSRDRSKPDGRHPRCKACRRAYQQAQLAQNGDAVRAYRRQYTKRWNAGNRERIRGYRFKSRYGIGGDEYDAMMEAQAGRCAICNEVETARRPDGTVRDLSVDHDHVTGAVRGLLCMLCNQALGAMRDDAERLRRAADYLERGAR